jgi:hypothetical protein
MKTPEEKVQDLMLKIRKGATASIDANALAKHVLPALGMDFEYTKFGKKRCTDHGYTLKIGEKIFKTYFHSDTIYQAKFQTKEPNVRSYYDLFPWLKAETDFMERVLCYLGMEEHVAGPARDLTNTGTCPICFRNVKLTDNGKIWNHGYRQGYNRGQHYGNCYGVGYRPYELSPDGSRVFLVRFATPSAENLATEVNRLERLHDQRPEKDDWKENQNLRDAEYQLRKAEELVKFFTAKVNDWKLQPLPGEKK